MQAQMRISVSKAGAQEEVVATGVKGVSSVSLQLLRGLMTFLCLQDEVHAVGVASLAAKTE